MADEPIDTSKASSTFPDPPTFWRDFTTEKLDRIDELRTRYADQSGLDIATIIRVPNVPEDLINLQPPAEPADGKWRLFGETLTVCSCFRVLSWILKTGADSSIARRQTPKPRSSERPAPSALRKRARRETYRSGLRPQTARQVDAAQLPRADGSHGYCS